MQYLINQLTNLLRISLLAIFCLPASVFLAQTGPSNSQTATYTDLLFAAHLGDVEMVKQLVIDGASIEQVDSAGSTALHITAYASHEDVVIELAKAGANMDALEHLVYDIVTIAAVANDIEMLKAALENGSSASNITSPYDGTALIAAAHLGHHEVVRILIEAGAPLDHVNNLGWTALIEAVVLGNGGEDHLQTTRHLIQAGANKEIADRDGQTPLMLAQAYGFDAIAQVISESDDN